MNYKESQEILEEIKKAKRILVNLHRGPDPDSFASAFALYYFLCSLKKDVSVVLTKTSELPGELVETEESKLIKKVDFARLDFSKYDLFISPDSGSWQQIVDNSEVKIPNLPIVVIDHHESNDKFGKLNLIEKEAGSCAEMVHKLFKDWDFYIDKSMAQLLLTGVIVDTGAFAFSDNPQSLRVAADLMDLGAKKTAIINKFFRTKKFKVLKYWGECFMRMEFDDEHKFVWTATPYEIEDKYKIHSSGFSTMFGGMVEGSNFGVIMSEDEKDVLKISFRSRNPDFDVSKLAEKLNGGGHKMAAGGIVKGLSFDKAVEKVLETARKYAKEN